MLTEIRSISVARLHDGSRYRAYAWDHATPQAGVLIGTTDGATIEEATHEMLRAIRGERPLTTTPTTIPRQHRVAEHA